MTQPSSGRSPGSIWNNLIAQLPDPHFLQTWEWSQIKAAYGWKPFFFIWSDGSYHSYTPEQLGQMDSAGLLKVTAACLVLKRTVLTRGLAARLCVLYAPKGPLLDWSNGSLRNRVLDDLQSYAAR